MTFADSQLQYVDLWGECRLFVGGKDVTNFRGKRVQIGSYQLTEPYSFGPADFTIPALTQFEVDSWGTGSLKWFGNGKPVVLKQLLNGSVVRQVWRGFITVTQVTPTGTQIHCDGEASGRLALRTKLPDLFSHKERVGRLIFEAFNRINLTVTPYLGGDVGVFTDGRGMTGSYLDYLDSLLAATITTGGAQYTIAHQDTGDYHLALKDTVTTDFTVFTGAHGVDIDLSDDLSERPNTIYGQGVAPNGLVWVNGKYPGLKQGETPPYPMTDDSAFGEGTTDADTDTGNGVTVMLSRLVGMGYLDRRDKPRTFDGEVTDGIKDLQDDAGLTQSGNMNPATWDALFDLGTTGFSLRRAYPAPLAQDTNVKKWLTTSSGALLARNPAFDPSIPEVDLFVDHGVGVEKSRARAYSRGVLTRSQNAKNWAGTITLTSDVFAGTHTHGGGSPTPMSRLDIKPGMNALLRGFDGDTKFHVSVVNVNGDASVTLGVDTQARDAATLGQVIARNIESRSHPARQWLQQRRTDAHTRFLEFSEVGGVVFEKVVCPGNKWTVFPVIAGQAGSVSRVRLQTSNDEAEFVLAITAIKTTREYWHQKAGNPFVGSGVAGISVTDGGSGYTSAPSVSISGGGGAGATAIARIGSTGTVTSIVLSTRGLGYTGTPSVTLSGGGGTGATATADVTLNDPWTNGKVQPLIDNQRALLGVWGDAAEPCGYYPLNHTGSDGEITDAPITGKFMEDAGFDYRTFSEPVLYVAIFPDRDTEIEPQRVLWEVFDSSQGG